MRAWNGNKTGERNSAHSGDPGNKQTPPMRRTDCRPSLITFIDTLSAPEALFEGNERTILRIANVEIARNENTCSKKVSKLVGGITKIPFSRDFTVSVAQAPTVVNNSLKSFASSFTSPV